jgi:hypothetical protein
LRRTIRWVRASLAVGLTFGLTWGMASAAVAGQAAGRPPDAELAAITERGRELAAYDQAVWHATDAVQMANPKTAQGERALARLENGKWRVVFGSLNSGRTKLMIDFVATQQEKPQEFFVAGLVSPVEDAEFFLFAARAQEIALADFGATARPYSSAVLRGPDERFYVYLYPAPTSAGVYPIGGDVRYLISGDGKQILEKRLLHKTIMEVSPAKGKKRAAGSHSHPLSDLPEDTDVLHVLQQDPPSPEVVATPHFVYEITADGTTRIKQEKRK